ncbi:MAG: hypothetical protein SVX43_06530, partial [Cyanobacteriota bacterium]|nr:hypothetical protein [Cyanobacteriota bacterium]
TANYNNTVQLWNQDGELLATLSLKDSVKTLEFSPDNTKLAISNDGKAVVLWDFARKHMEELSDQEIEPLIEQACNKVGNYLKNNVLGNDRGLCRKKQPNFWQR